MSIQKSDLPYPPGVGDYVLSSIREPDVLRRLREETARDPKAIMQIPPDQGQLMMFLVQALGAKKALEIGTYTGYSALCVALALPSDGRLVACDINGTWADVGRRYWQEAGVAHKIDFVLGPALQTLDGLIASGEAGSFDFAFIDADKGGYDGYYERCLALLRTGGIVAIDNVLMFGAVVDPDQVEPGLRARVQDADIDAMRRLNIKIKNDARVDLVMLKIADGLTLVRKR